MIARALILAVLLLVAGDAAFAQSLPAVTVDQLANGQQTYSLSIQVLALMTALTVLPALILSMTAFTRIVIVLAILRQALGTPQTPPNQVLIGLSRGYNAVSVLEAVKSTSPITEEKHR